MKILADMTVPATLESLEGLLKSAIGSALQCGLTGESLFSVELATEETLVNVFNYAYPHGEGNVRLRCMGEGDRFIIEVTDRGVPFDPTAQPDPDVSGPLKERPVGGRGIYLTKKITDEMRYSREDGRNILCLFIRKKGTSEGESD